MRGELNPQGHMFSYFSPETRVPQDHPLRAIKHYADEALKPLAATFEAMYSDTGRPSIPPERLLKASLLIALYSVRSDRLFCEQLGYNILFRWFLDMSLEEASFDPSTFSKNRERLMAHDVTELHLPALEQSQLKIESIGGKISLLSQRFMHKSPTTLVWRGIEAMSRCYRLQPHVRIGT